MCGGCARDHVFWSLPFLLQEELSNLVDKRRRSMLVAKRIVGTLPQIIVQ